MTARKGCFRVKVLLPVFALLLIFQDDVSANLLKCRHKIGAIDKAQNCHCKFDDVLRCDLMRAKEILRHLKERAERESSINEEGELERIINYLISVDAAEKYEKDVRWVIDSLKEVILYTDDQMSLPGLVISFAKIGSYADYYGRNPDDVLPKILKVYRNVESTKVKYFQNYEEVGFRFERGGEDLLSILRTTIYNIDSGKLPKCPDIILKYSPKSCEIGK